MKRSIESIPKYKSTYIEYLLIHSINKIHLVPMNPYYLMYWLVLSQNLKNSYMTKNPKHATIFPSNSDKFFVVSFFYFSPISSNGLVLPEVTASARRLVFSRDYTPSSPQIQKCSYNHNAPSCTLEVMDTFVHSIK